jgi:hypothetical protein
MTMTAALDASVPANVVQIHTSGGITFDAGDTATFVFDKPIIINFLDFSSLAQNDDVGRITIGAMTPWEFNYDNLSGTSANTITDPFNGLVIPAGTNFKVDGVVSSWRMAIMHVTPVPEPSSITLVGTCIAGLVSVRARRRNRLV